LKVHSIQFNGTYNFYLLPKSIQCDLPVAPPNRLLTLSFTHCATAAKGKAERVEARKTYRTPWLVDGSGRQQGDQEELLLKQVNEFIAIRPAKKWVERFCEDGKINPGKA
jgi:hypothetical protein